MRLEHDDRALIVKRIDRIEQRAQFARVVCIIIVQIRALELALIIKPAASTFKTGETVLDGVRTDAEHDGRSRSRECVAHIVDTRNVDRHMGKRFPR